MQLANIVGHATATVKHKSMTGWKLLIAQPLTTDAKPDGEPQLVIDNLGAGLDDRVIICNDGAGTRKLMNFKELAGALVRDGNLRLMKDASPTSVLCWPKRLLSAEDLRRHLTSQRELVLLPKTIVTPLASDELRAKGVRIRCEESSAVESKSAKWFYAQEKQATSVATAIQALEREGISIEMREGSIRTLAESLVANSVGGVIITSDPAVVVCVANKVAGVRAVSVANVAHVTRAKKSVGANLFAIDAMGSTFFEMRQMLKTIVTGSASCPPEVAKTLQELDGHAHR